MDLRDRIAIHARTGTGMDEPRPAYAVSSTDQHPTKTTTKPRCFCSRFRLHGSRGIEAVVHRVQTWRPLGNTPGGRLGQHAPFPYGSARPPSDWELGENSPYLTVPPFYHHVDQTDHCAASEDANEDELFLPKRGILSLGSRIIIALFLFTFAIFIFFTFFAMPLKRSIDVAHRTIPSSLIFPMGIYLVSIFVALSMSPLVTLFMSKNISLEEAGSFIRPYLSAIPVVRFECWHCDETLRAFRRRGIYTPEQGSQRPIGLTKEWRYTTSQNVVPSAEYRIVTKIKDLAAQKRLVRIQIKLETELADDATVGAFMTELHQFHLLTKRESPYLGIAAYWTTPSREGFDRFAIFSQDGKMTTNLKILRFIYMTSVYLCLWWIIDIAAFVFFPRLYDPSQSTTVRIRKRLSCVAV